MRRIAPALLGLSLFAACRSTEVPLTADASERAGLPDAAAPDLRTYGPAVLQAQSCAAPPDGGAPRALALPGCEACKADEFCQRFSVHGRDVGSCTKSNCARDADCPGALCACGPPNLCATGNCRTADDCGGRECGIDRWRYGHGVGAFCRTANDTCSTHASCGPGKECAYVVDRWTCRTETPAPPPG